MIKDLPEQHESPYPVGDVPTVEQLQTTVLAMIRRVAEKLADQLLAETNSAQTKTEPSHCPRSPD